MQFENDMKAYKDCDLFPEEEEEKQEHTPSFNQKQSLSVVRNP